MMGIRAKMVAILAAAILAPACGSGGGGNSGGSEADSPGISSASLPSAPAGVVATAGDASVALSWDPVPGAGGYNVKRALSSGGPYALVEVFFPKTAVVDHPLSNGVRYFYVVSAVNNTGEGPDSVEVSAKPHHRNGDGDSDDDPHHGHGRGSGEGD